MEGFVWEAVGGGEVEAGFESEMGELFLAAVMEELLFSVIVVRWAFRAFSSASDSCFVKPVGRFRVLFIILISLLLSYYLHHFYSQNFRHYCFRYL